jgi:hypothetical protein
MLFILTLKATQTCERNTKTNKFMMYATFRNEWFAETAIDIRGREEMFILTPANARTSFISDSTTGSVAAGLGQSVPFSITGFHMPRVISAEK